MEIESLHLQLLITNRRAFSRPTSIPELFNCKIFSRPTRIPDYAFNYHMKSTKPRLSIVQVTAFVVALGGLLTAVTKLIEEIIKATQH